MDSVCGRDAGSLKRKKRESCNRQSGGEGGGKSGVTHNYPMRTKCEGSGTLRLTKLYPMRWRRKENEKRRERMEHAGWDLGDSEQAVGSLGEWVWLL